MGGPASKLDSLLPDLWDDAHAAKLDEPGLLLYRSNLLGSDLRITNFGGGNTSAKLTGADPLTGAPVKVLWVKGSGGDLGSMKLDGFATLYLDKLLGLKSVYRGLAHEDEMVALFNHCTFNLNPRATSIDTPLHGFVPHAHVDHMHADAVIAIAASENAEALTRKVFGGELGFLPWQRPGFDLGLKLGAMAEANPGAQGRRARRPRPLHLGADLEGLLRDDARDDQQGLRLARRQRARRGFRRRGRRQRCRPSSGATSPRGSCRRSASASRRASARSAISPTRRKCSNSSIRATSSRWRRSAPPAPTISCARRSGRWSCRSTRRR